MSAADLIPEHLKWTYDGVVILGWGREAQGASRFLDAYFPDTPVIVLYEGEEAPELPVGVEAQSQAAFLDIGLQMACDGPLVLRSPGVPPDNPVLKKLADLGAEITTPTGYWLSLQGRERLITVTGTKGKSTTVSLITHLLRAGGMNAVSVGNIGAPPLDDRPFEVDVVVAELSSYQLHDAMGAGQVHVITNLFREHTDWHGGHDAYGEAKLSPASRHPDITILSQPDLLARLPDSHHGPRLSFEDLVRADLTSGQITLPGQASIDVAALNPRLSGPVMTLSVQIACAAILAAGHLTPEDLYQALKTGLPTWSALPHRLQTLGDVAGVRWVDDSLATVPEAVLSAFQSVAKRPLHAVMGGRHRGQDWQDFVTAVAGINDIQLYLFGTIAHALAEALSAAGLDHRFSLYESLDQALVAAHNASQESGGTLLFSPGAASELPHRNYEHRAAILRAVFEAAKSQ